jgi:RNA-directed DNA polymerase
MDDLNGHEAGNGGHSQASPVDLVNQSFTLDAVAFFQHQEDARRFIQEVRGRLEKFGLSLHPEKTRLVIFNRCYKQSGIFDFLGFTFYWGKTRKGVQVVKCRTSKKRFVSKVKRFKEWLRENRSRMRLREIWKVASQKMRGHFAYYGVSYNILKL